MALLDVQDLRTEYRTAAGRLMAVDGISFSVSEGEALGVIGESGCGKSTIMKSVLRLLPDGARIAGGQVRFRGEDLGAMSPERLNRLRWNEIALISQSSMNALNPVYRVGDQIVEVLTVKGAMPRREAEVRAAELFRVVGLDAKRLRDYPHQLSGGMRQRSMIAMALALDPALVIADEPTTALDVVVQDRILQQIGALQRERKLALLFVTHDIAVVAGLCQRAMVMYAGKAAEIGTTRQVFKQPCHPYTMGLVMASPSVHQRAVELVSIPGYPPDLTRPPQGCRFAPRCPFAAEQCRAEVPAVREVEPGHAVACHFAERGAEMRSLAAVRTTWERGVQHG